MRKVVVLGAGPAGLFFALELLRRPEIGAEVVIVEKRPAVGGMAGSFEHAGLTFDYGSHRLHAAAPPRVLRAVAALVGAELLSRRRNGRIRLQGGFVKFPLHPLDLARGLPARFLGALLYDRASRALRPKRAPGASFAEVLAEGLGPRFCQAFYFPYARKLWGLEPEEISAVQARRRVSAGTTGKLLRKALAGMPPFRARQSGHFLYPRRGFGQICDAMAREIARRGGRLMLATAACEVRLQEGRVAAVGVRPAPAAAGAGRPVDGPPLELPADLVFSTLPIGDLAACLRPGPPPAVADACRQLRYRGLLLLYLVLQANRFTPFDAHYFPEEGVCFSRLSEPKNYSGAPEPAGRTGLCIEIPCWAGDETWQAPAEAIQRRVTTELAACGLPVRAPIEAAFIRRLPHAYPVPALGHERPLRAAEEHLDGVRGLVCAGRQGVFMHDNTHHALEMAQAAAACVEPDGGWNPERWRRCRRRFETFVVED